MLEQKKNTSNLTEALSVVKRKDLGARVLRFSKDQQTVEVSGLDSLLVIQPNSVAGFVFEYKTGGGKKPLRFKIKPDTTKDYLISKISLNVEFYNANKAAKTDSLSSYIFTRVF